MCTESIIDGRRGDLGRFPWEYRALPTKAQPKQAKKWGFHWIIPLLTGVHYNLSYFIYEKWTL